jgi:uridylate kinase
MIEELSYDRFLAERMGVMDGTAVTLCRDNRLPIRVFKLSTKGNIQRVVLGDEIGTVVRDPQKR